MSSGDRHRRNVEGLIYEGLFGGLGVQEKNLLHLLCESNVNFSAHVILEHTDFFFCYIGSPSLSCFYCFLYFFKILGKKYYIHQVQFSFLKNFLTIKICKSTHISLNPFLGLLSNVSHQKWGRRGKEEEYSHRKQAIEMLHLCT